MASSSGACERSPSGVEFRCEEIEPAVQKQRHYSRQAVAVFGAGELDMDPDLGSIDDASSFDRVHDRTKREMSTKLGSSATCAHLESVLAGVPSFVDHIKADSSDRSACKAPRPNRGDTEPRSYCISAIENRVGDFDRARQPAGAIEGDHDAPARGGRSRPATKDDEWGAAQRVAECDDGRGGAAVPHRSRARRCASSKLMAANGH